MPKVVREENNDNLTAVLTIQIDKADYEPQFKAELRKKAKNTRLKGFRQGKTSHVTLVKMFGKSLLPAIVTEMLQKEIDKHIKEHDLKLFGSLLPNENFKEPVYDHKNLGDYEFKLDLAYFPEFELKGLDKDHTYQRYDLQLSDDDVFETIENIKKQAATNVEVTEDIEENDIVRLKVQELEGDEIKADGATGEFPMLVNTIVDEDIKAELLTKKHGDTLRLNIFKLEKAVSDDHTSFVRKNYLSLPDDDPTVVGEEYEATITEVKRLKEAELNQDFYDKAFGPDVVHNEEEMKEKIKTATKVTYNVQVDGLVFNDIQAKVIELNNFELPGDFLVRWFKSQKGNENQTVDTDDFVKSMRWSLLRNRIIENFGIKVTEDDLKTAAANMMRQYMGYADPAMIEQILKNQETVNKLSEDALSAKIVQATINAVTIENKAIDFSEYQAMIEKMQAESQAKAAALAAAQTEATTPATVELTGEEE